MSKFQDQPYLPPQSTIVQRKLREVQFLKKNMIIYPKVQYSSSI